MKAGVKKILFVSHDAGRSGAPIVLLTFLQWLKKNTNIEITVLLKRTGSLHNDFAAVGTTYCWIPQTYKPVKHDIVSRIKRRITKPDPFVPFPEALEEQQFDLVYLNTVVTLDLAPLLKAKYNCPVVAHVHEMEYSINAEFSAFLSDVNKKAVDHYIAVSKDVQHNLVQNHHIPCNSVSLVYEFINTEKITTVNRQYSALKEPLKQAGDFLVGGAGFSTWRKGIDLFIYTAAYIKRNYPGEQVKFVWVGQLDTVYSERIRYEMVRSGVEEDIFFTGAIDDPATYFNLYDIFLLTSKEDPFPLVCLEAAALGKPVICFKQAGGMNEFIEQGGGISVDYAGTEQMAAAIIALKHDRERLDQLSEAARASVQYYDVSIAAPLLHNIINETVASVGK